MASPFPGMDPYLEDPAIWPDFHARFINYWCEYIADRLPGNYDARIGERVTLMEPLDEPAEQTIPDAAIREETERLKAPKVVSNAATISHTLEPVELPLAIPALTKEPRVELYQTTDRSVLAVLELLSPWSKSGGRHIYLEERMRLLSQEVHLIELDLLLGGRRLPMGKRLPPGDYYAFVAHSQRRFNCDVYAWTVRQPLPMLPIPLKAPDPDLRINIAEVFSQAYDRGRYERCLRYAEPPTAPLADADRQWAAEMARRAR